MSKRSLGLLLLGICLGSSGVAHAAITANPSPLTIRVPLGQALIGETTLSSTDAVSVTLSLDESGSDDCGPFDIESATTVTVGPGDNEIVQVRFTPGTATGLETCTLEGQASGGGPGAEISVQLRGIGLDFTVAPLSLSFGGIDVGGTSATQRVIATNNGATALTISSATVSSNATQYTVNGTAGSQSVAAGTSVHWDIACRPTAQGGVDGNFRIVSNAVVDGTVNVPLTCTGNRGLAVTNPTTHDFQTVVQGQTEQLTFALRNDGNVSITGLTGVLNDATLGYVFDAGSVPATLAAGASVNLTVNFTPQNGGDGGDATITFSGVWGTGARNTTAVLNLDGDGLGVGFTATPTLSFNDFRFDARPQLVYQVENSGDVNLTIDTATFAPAVGTVDGELVFTIRRNGTPVTLPETLAPNERLDVTVTAQPNNRIGPIGGTVVVHSNTPATVDQPVAIGGNATAAVVSATTIADFDKVDIDGGPQVKTITVTNTGSAVLDIPAITTMNVNPAFMISAPAAPTTLAAGASLNISVTYDPTLERAPGNFDEGLLVVGLAGVLGGPMQAPTQAMIPLKGRGTDRHVAVVPVDEPQPAFVGEPDGSSFAVTVRNTGEAPLNVTSAEVTPASEWAVDAGGFVVEGLSERSLTVRFTPKAGGTRMGTLTLETDDGATTISLTGDALFVEAVGGGGCSAGGTGAGGALVFGVLALALAFGRRRRCAALAAVAVVALAPAAHAQEKRDNVNVTVFAPTPATTGTGFQVQSAEVGASGSWVASSILSYASELLVFNIRRGGEAAPASVDPVLSRSTLLQLGAAFAFLDRFELGAHMPLYMQDGEASSTRMEPAVRGSARGNVSLHGKAQLWRGGGVALGTSASVILPTASDQKLAGSDGLEARLLVLGSLALGSRLAIMANAGAILREKAEYVVFAQGSGVAWGAGASYRVLDSLSLTAEMFGKVTPAGLNKASSDPAPMPEGMASTVATTLSQIEWLGGLHLKADRRFTIGLAVGRGVTNALGTPDLRGVVSLAFVPGAPAVAPIDPPEVPRPDVDSDGDGLLDRADKCPAEAEDRDMFDDADGCPDGDNDGDRVADAQDRCPLDPEDADGFEDSDGCSEKDNDGDGIADAQDKCRNDAEDKDGFQDVDGCAEPDNDRDGLADADDRCPGEPETINAIKDEDGCPDKGDTTIVLSPDRIETHDPIVFTGLRLARPSLPVLAQVGATLRAHGEIVRVRITVHVHPTNDPDADQARSEKRAQVVRDWLIQFGIAPARLEMRGFGGSKPLVAADKRGAAKINERIELIILERK